MKIYISADIEGVGCVVRKEHSSPAGREYAFARKQMTAEVNAAARGAFDAGAAEVVVVDAHNVGLNIMPDELDERVDLIMGSPRPLCMMEGVDMGFDAVFFIGYHAMAKTANGPIVHIFTGRVAEVKMNGLSIGEIGLSAILAGYYNAPVALVAGDEQACLEAKALLPDVETVSVKKGIGANAAFCLHPKKCCNLIQAAAQKALANIPRLTPFILDGLPVELEVRFTTPSAVDRVIRMPGVERLDGVTVRFMGRDALEAFKAFNTMADLIDLVPGI